MSIDLDDSLRWFWGALFWNMLQNLESKETGHEEQKGETVHIGWGHQWRNLDASSWQNENACSILQQRYCPFFAGTVLAWVCMQESPNFIWYSSIINYVFHLRPSNNKNFKWGKRNPRQLDLAKQVPIFTGHSPFTGKRQGRKKHDNHKYNTKCISTHISIMLLMLHGNSSDIRVRM